MDLSDSETWVESVLSGTSCSIMRKWAASSSNFTRTVLSLWPKAINDIIEMWITKSVRVMDRNNESKVNVHPTDLNDLP